MTIRSYKNKTPVIGDKTYIDDSAIVIGGVTIGNDVSIWPLTVIRSDVNSICIGNKTNIQDGSVLHVTHDGPYDYNHGGYALNIGNNITVGHNVILHGCTIGDNCLIGMGSTIMDGVVIKPNTIIGAGSLVSPSKQLDEGCLYVGRPVKKVRKLNNDEIESIQYSANHYVELKNTYLEEL
ncbi:Carbonic anhydrase, gamma class [hydrothermal vent metagenome]|uniref:Carbonic anhydrase, gamma class n=1 Tax=hydrothermal vent metagenome TaxID=652676 RepID=A0A3B1A7U7_9ZZZZ